MNLLGFLDGLPQLLGPVLATLAGLITVDLILGISVALRTGTFEWIQVTKFYKTNVLPYGLWAIASGVFVKFVTLTELPAPALEALKEWGIYAATAPLFAQLVFGSIIPNLRALIAGETKYELYYRGLEEAVERELEKASENEGPYVPGV